MFARSLRLALTTAVACPAVLAAQGFEYAPSAGQYRLTSATKGAQEMMGQRNDFESSTNQLLSLAITKAAKDTLVLTTVIDSIHITLPMGMAMPGIEKLAGTKVTSRIAPNGVVYSYTAEGLDTTAVPNAAQLPDQLSRVLPRIRASLAAGATWTATDTIKARQGGLTVDRIVTTKYSVAGDTTVGAEKSWKIATESNTAMSGSGEQGGQPMSLEGTATSKGILVISRGNVFLGAQTEEQSNIKIVLAATGMEVGVDQTTTNKIEKVK